MSALDAHDRRIIAQARELTALTGIGGVRERAGTDDTMFAFTQFFGEAKFVLAELAAIAERLGGSEDARRLDRIRDVLAHFDWEHHDRQLALEAIERIADGGQR